MTRHVKSGKGIAGFEGLNSLINCRRKLNVYAFESLCRISPVWGKWNRYNCGVLEPFEGRECATDYDIGICTFYCYKTKRNEKRLFLRLKNSLDLVARWLPSVSRYP